MRPHVIRVALVVLAVEVARSALGTGPTFTVINTSDSGAGSLRQAILDSNGSPGHNTIDFNIPGTGPFTIQLASALPSITNPVILDGYSQPGASQNTNPPGQGFNTVLEIQISGVEPPAFGCLDVEVGNSGTPAMVVRGLVVNHCTVAISVGAAGQNAGIQGNFIGTDSSGTIAENLAGQGIHVNGASGVLVAGNLISGNTVGPPPTIELDTANNTVVAGNLIGTDKSGAIFLGNGANLLIYNSTGVTIGGTTLDQRNVISGSSYGAINDGFFDDATSVLGNFIGTDVTGTRAFSTNDNGVISIGTDLLVSGNVIGGMLGGLDINGTATVLGNFIGTDPSGTLNLGLTGWGIIAQGGSVQIGGIGPGQGNVIAHCGSGGYGGQLNGGVVVLSPATIRGNSILDNAPLGIDIGGDGIPNPNDPCGANDSQNFPIVSAMSNGDGTTTVSGHFNGAPGQSYTLDFYADPICLPRPRMFLQGMTYLGSTVVSLGGSCETTFSVSLPVGIEPGQPVTGTATDLNGATSEFSQRLPFSIAPNSGHGDTAHPFTVYGTDFEAGAVVTVGPGAATGVSRVSSTEITAKTPPLTPGSAYDVTVTNLDGTTGTLSLGWVADFLDVPSPQQFHVYVNTIVSNGITAGIGGGFYGVNEETLRQQMAVFLLKGEHGICYQPPACTGVFRDVPCPSPFADWIEALAAEGITGGCGGGGTYCPQDPVRRDQMAVFLLNSEHGSSYVPPACSGIFSDVTCPSQFADWIEQLSAEGITGGCGNGNYCPSRPVTRGQMAVFLVKTLGLQL